MCRAPRLGFRPHLECPAGKARGGHRRNEAPKPPTHPQHRQGRRSARVGHVGYEPHDVVMLPPTEASAVLMFSNALHRCVPNPCAGFALASTLVWPGDKDET